MTNQEAFERSVRWCMTQKRACMKPITGLFGMSRGTPRCAYVGEDPAERCGVGCLVDLELAKLWDTLGFCESAWEDVEIAFRERKLLGGLETVNSLLLRDLQVVHDRESVRARSPEDRLRMWEVYTRIAIIYDLTLPEDARPAGAP